MSLKEDLFSANAARFEPLAARVRPKTLDEIIGQEHHHVGTGCHRAVHGQETAQHREEEHARHGRRMWKDRLGVTFLLRPRLFSGGRFR